MLNLSMATPDLPDPTSTLASKIKWSVVLPWALSFFIFGTQVYHRFANLEEARASEVAEVKALTKEVTDLKQQVARLTVIVERIETAQAEDRRARRGGP